MIDLTKLFPQDQARNALTQWTQPFEQWSKTLDGHDDAHVQYGRDLGYIAQAHGKQAMETAQANAQHNLETWQQVMSALATPMLAQHWWQYVVDGAQRSVLYADAMRERGNYFVEHEEGSHKTVLSWDHEMVVDGTKLARPVNYSLVRIIPPEGVSVREDGRR